MPGLFLKPSVLVTDQLDLRHCDFAGQPGLWTAPVAFKSYCRWTTHYVFSRSQGSLGAINLGTGEVLCSEESSPLRVSQQPRKHTFILWTSRRRIVYPLNVPL